MGFHFDSKWAAPYVSRRYCVANYKNGSHCECTFGKRVGIHKNSQTHIMRNSFHRQMLGFRSFFLEYYLFSTWVYIVYGRYLNLFVRIWLDGFETFRWKCVVCEIRSTFWGFSTEMNRICRWPRQYCIPSFIETFMHTHRRSYSYPNWLTLCVWNCRILYAHTLTRM